MMAIIDIMIIGCLVSAAAAIPGCFLILRRMAMMSDAISHSVLLGIVVMFLIIRTLHSPLLIVAAAATGLMTVVLTELLIASKRIKRDAAIGLIFPLFFAIAIIMINQFASGVHLDQDAVILGEIAFAPFHRWTVMGVDLGPVGAWLMGGVLVINTLFLTLFYKELMVSTFDSLLATSMGFRPRLLHYGLMGCVSLTCVAAFNVVGTILIVALIITPPASAYLLTNRLSTMVVLSVGIGCVCTVLGVGAAVVIDASIAGSMCAMAGLVFILIFLFSPEHGLIKKAYNQRRKTIQFSAMLLTIQFFNHRHPNRNPFEFSIKNLTDHMRWSESFSKKVIGYAVQNNFIVQHDAATYRLTPFGEEVAKNAIQST